MRLGLLLLLFAAATGGAGFSGLSGPATDYFRVVSVGCLVLAAGLLVGRVGRHRRVRRG